MTNEAFVPNMETLTRELGPKPPPTMAEQTKPSDFAPARIREANRFLPNKKGVVDRLTAHGKALDDLTRQLESLRDKVRGMDPVPHNHEVPKTGMPPVVDFLERRLSEAQRMLDELTEMF